MENTIGCPSADVLQDLIQGKVPEPDLSELSSHVEACTDCQEIARTLPPHDTLVEESRGD